MPSVASGRIVKTSKRKRGTETLKSHRWESFTSKINKLNTLDPIRRVRRHDLDSEDLSTSTSYFRSGLEKWQELIINDEFGQFVHDVTPLCDSLPQILHFEDQIMDLLATHIEKRNKDTLEGLLALLTDFAHDLGVRFEKHYAKCLVLVSSIAGSAAEIEPIEWSFSCLAFMFKYLSRLLVADLRPTYDTLSPLLGKARHPPHIARFTAEGLSFLIRKVGSPSQREKGLPLIVKHVRADLLTMQNEKQFNLYYHGVMTMFAAAAKGSGTNIHSAGPAILQSLFHAIADEDLTGDDFSYWIQVILGVLISLIHHSTSDTFKEIMQCIITEANVAVQAFEVSKTRSSLRRLVMSSRTIGIIAGVRFGSRVSDWPAVLATMSRLLKALSANSQFIIENGQDKYLWQYVVLSACLVLEYAPIDAAIPKISSLMDSLTKDPLGQWFLVFCAYLGRTSSERFKSFVLPYFQRFVIAHWSDPANGDTLCILLPELITSGVLPGKSSGKEGFSIPQSWQDQIVSKFESLERTPFPERGSSASYDRDPKAWHDQCLPKYHGLLDVLEYTNVHPSTNARISEILHRKLKLALRPSSALAQDEAYFIVGKGFSAFSHMTLPSGKTDASLRPLLHAAALRYCRLPSFLQAMLAYETSLKLGPAENVYKSDDSSDDEGDIDLLTKALIENLASESKEVRQLSLQLLEQLTSDRGSLTTEALSLMIMIEEIPLGLQTARSASMHIRKLGSMYKQLPGDSTIARAIPYFLFGMLNVKLAQIWDDASAALQVITETKHGEEVVTELAFRWLEVPSVVTDHSTKFLADEKQAGLTDFECSNLMRCDSSAKEMESKFNGAQEVMLDQFESAHQLVPEKPEAARSQALRVLSGIPQIAEKHSRRLIPMFLSWAGTEDSDDMEDSAFNFSDWTRRDQKSQLDLFSKFLNPRVLYKSEEVRSALFRLLANGDIEIQKSALKSVFTWKFPGVKPYEVSLLNILDETRFKDEVTILLQGETAIQPQHRLDVMPVLLRLLYGRTVAKGLKGMESRRLMVIRNLGPNDLQGFLDIALGNLRDFKLLEGNHLRHSAFSEELLTVRKQNGFVHMVEDFLKETAAKVGRYVPQMLDALLYCLISAARTLQTSGEDVQDEETERKDISLQKSVRTTGLRCLILLFTNAQQYDWMPYVPTILGELINPRLEKLPIENAQGASGTLQLLSTWASSPHTVLFLSQNPLIVQRVVSCLTVPKAKESVKLFVLEIINKLVKIARDEEQSKIASQVRETLLDTNMDDILIQIGKTLRANEDISKDLLETCVSTVSELASVVSGTAEARNLIDVAIYLLDQPSRRVSPKAKSGLLRVLEHFVPLYNLQSDPGLKDKIYNTITSLFGYFKDRNSREVLSRVLLAFSKDDPVISDIATLCTDLNSFSDTKLEEPDYDRRLRAFVELNKVRETPFTAFQWRPLLFNALYYIKHDEEFGILSSNSSDTIRNFLDSACAQSLTDKAFEDMVANILLPNIFSGVREPSEVVRREIVQVMSKVVKTFPVLAEVEDMKTLLAGDDEVESSFFNNILAAGKGRRSTALSQVVRVAASDGLSSRNVSQFFIPLFEHFIFDRGEGNDAHGLAAEATNSIAALAQSLEWSQYRAVLRRYIGFISSKQELEKQIIRLVGKVIDALAQWTDAANKENVEDAKESSRTPRLASSLPSPEKLSEDVTGHIIPPLVSYLHEKDESTVSLRVPVAVIIVRLLKLLPEEKMNERLPGVLTDLCHILRSKAQESREMTRDTLIKICTLLGPSHFGFVLKELRGALARGYQLHVLSYTMHSILVATTPIFKPGDLDYCLPSIVSVIMDDIFGVTGQEKDAEEYTSKMKEVKSSKSHDSMELVASRATLGRLTDLIRPIQSLLREKLDIRIVRKIDELLSRISTGLLKNPAAESRDSLIFCYEVIQQVYKQEQAPLPTKEDLRAKRYLLQKGASKGGSRGATTVSIHKLARFAFDILRTLVKRYDNLCSSANLTGFIPIIGDAVVQPEEEVKIAALKLLSTIVRVPFKNEEEATNLYKVAVAESIKCISYSTSISTDIAQAAFKLISVVLRDRGEVPIKESSIDKLLSKMKDDITNPDTRHITFTFIRSVLDAKIETAGVYDTLDYVGTVMVTNPDRTTRDLARGAYFQFLRVYPQTRRRWSKQLAFVVSNLKYEQEGGRLSILEVIRLLLSKSSSEFVQEVAATCFVPLIMVLANDESEQCRSTAGEVLKEMFIKADRERTKTFLDLLRGWITQYDKPSVVRLGLQAYGFYYDTEDTASKNESDVILLRDSITEVLASVGGEEEEEEDWELLYAAIQLSNVLSRRFSDRFLTVEASALWSNAMPCLSYPHAWVKLSVSKLYGTYLRTFAQENLDTNKGLRVPVRGPNKLSLTESEIIELINRSLRIFKTPSLSEDLANQTVQNIVFLARCAADGKLDWTSHSAGAGDSDDEEAQAESDEEAEHPRLSALEVIFRRISVILRREVRPPHAPFLIPKTSALSLLKQLCSTFTPEKLSAHLEMILLPLQNITDPSIPTPYSTDELFKSNYEAMKASASGLMHNLQNKMGATAYTAALLQVREGVRSRRDQRTQKRKVEAITAPERRSKEKMRKVERKKERRKEKGQMHRDARRGY